MKLISNRRRAVALGPYPLEKLSRAETYFQIHRERPLRPAPLGNQAPVPFSLAAAMEPQSRLYRELAAGVAAPPMENFSVAPPQWSDNLKASCYFLDASMVGICAIPETAWYREGEDGKPLKPYHRYALVILVEEGRLPNPGTMEAAWIESTQSARGEMRAMEIAAVMAGYLRSLGNDARAHSIVDGDLAQDELVLASGLGFWREKERAVVNPFVGRRYHTAVVTTNLELAVDAPLRMEREPSRLGVLHLGHLLGAWGVRPAWRRLTGDHRPLHLSRFPMEKIARRERPTTYISDAVPRIPKRASFFDRAVYGDLGERPKFERTRFATKHPLTQGMAPLMKGLVPLQDGKTAVESAPGTQDPAANAQAVKALCYYLGIDLAGICEAPPFAWYSHGDRGKPIEADHRYAIVVLTDQGHETMEGASGDDWISGSQSMRAYMRGAEITNTVAAHIRNLGYSARAHTNSLSEVLHIPLVLLSGLGELSRIGELVLNPFVGPRFKSAVITTNMPLAVDQPINFGLQDFCEKCHKCARECPCWAISSGDKVMFNGYEIWKPDVEKCAKYRLTNQKGSACGRCMKACPYNTEGLLVHRWFLWVAIKLPFLRRWIAHLDDWVGNGTRNPIKRWWFDLEMVEGRAVRAKGANERDLNLKRKVETEKQRVAHYPASMAPPPGEQGPFPPDRMAALREAEHAANPPSTS